MSSERACGEGAGLKSALFFWASGTLYLQPDCSDWKEWWRGQSTRYAAIYRLTTRKKIPNYCTTTISLSSFQNVVERMFMLWSDWEYRPLLQHHCRELIGVCTPLTCTWLLKLCLLLLLFWSSYSQTSVWVRGSDYAHYNELDSRSSSNSDSPATAAPHRLLGGRGWQSTLGCVAVGSALLDHTEPGGGAEKVSADTSEGQEVMYCWRHFLLW